MKNKDTWKEEFDDNFFHGEDDIGLACEELLNNQDGKCNCQLKLIKSFIQQVRKEYRERIKNIISRIEIPKKYYLPMIDPQLNAIATYKQAIDDILHQLERENEK